MIVLATARDESLAADLQVRLHSHLPEDALRTVVTLHAAHEVLAENSSAPAIIFAVGENIEGLTETVRRLRVATEIPIVAVSRDSRAQTILKLVRAGAVDYYDIGSSPASELINIISRLRRPASGSRGGKVIYFSSASGGCGSSCMAVNVGAVLAERGTPVCLIDLDLRGGSLASLLNLQPAHHLIDLCNLGRPIDEAVFESALAKHESKMSLLASPPWTNCWQQVDYHVVTQALDMARNQFSNVIVDVSDATRVEQPSLLAECDLFVIAFRMELPCILKARELVKHLREIGVDFSKIRLAANQCPKRQELPREKVVEVIGAPICCQAPEDSPWVSNAANIGAPVIWEAPSSRFTKAMRELAAALD